MRRRWRGGWWLGWILALAPAVRAQPQPPLLPELPAEVLPSPCVTRYGHTGCAARLYAQLLCNSVGASVDWSALQSSLAEAFEQERLDFRGISAEQVETAAVRYYSPMLCPAHSDRIQQLFR